MNWRFFLGSNNIFSRGLFNERIRKDFSNYFLKVRRRAFSNAPSEFEQVRYYRERFVKKQAELRKKKLSIALYAGSVIVLVASFGYGMSPLYKIFCQKTGMGGYVAEQHPTLDPSKMIPVRIKSKIKVQFVAHSMNKLPWTFEPLQEFVVVKPGETALAFFKATNPTTHDIKGVATYNIVPAQAAPYFVKIQCFCFEEQKLYAGESIDMPVFFYIDPDILLDSTCVGLEDILLAYTFYTSEL